MQEHDHPEAVSFKDCVARDYEGADVTGLPLAILEMREVTHRLHAEISQLAERLAPVLVPENTPPTSMAEIAGRPMSPAAGDLAQIRHDIQRATLRVAELFGRLDL